MEQRIRYGLRRYPLLVVVFLAASIGFVVWSRSIDGPTYVFPLGTLAPDAARAVLSGVAAAAALYVAAISYVRFWRRPEVILGEDAITLPVGEFGSRTVTVRRGEVLRIDLGTHAGGWQSARVLYTGGELTVYSNQLPDDGAFHRVYDALVALAKPAARARRTKEP